jgi:glycosyltransferase involved in cell wall biosynthesis
MNVTFVLPADVDDVTMISGGNVYDRRVCQGLAEAGRPVREVPVAGTWPQPEAPAREELTRSLAALPDGAVVLLDGLVACGVPDVVVPQANRLRLVVLVHLPLAQETGLEPDIAADLDARERETLQAASAVVATSPWTADRLVQHHRLATSRVHLVSPGTDPAPLAAGTDGASRLLCVASVTPLKGQDLLVEALADVADLPWTCECVGPLRRAPRYVEQVRELIVRCGVADRVRLPGPRIGEPLAHAYAAADLVVLPSRAETYGMVVTEALARGIPVLATAVQGVPGTLGRAPDGSVPGILVPADDVAALAAALRGWFGDGELRNRLRRSARLRRGMLGSWNDTSQRLALVLDRLVS